MQGSEDEEHPVQPRGGVVRQLRHDRGWSPRALIEAIADASRIATGIAETITPNLLAGIEEHDEPVPYETLCLVAGGFDCDPIDLLADERSVAPEEGAV